MFRDDGGVWSARASREFGGRYKNSVRHLEDSDVFDAHRLIRTGPDAWRPSYLGSATTLERAQALALANYKRLRTSIGNFEQGVRAQRKIF
jgi:hypothetical protein